MHFRSKALAGLLIAVSAVTLTVSGSALAAFYGAWDTQPGCLSQIASTSDMLFGVGCGGGSQAIFFMQSSKIPNDQWTRMPGAAVQVAVGKDDWPWVINSAGSIYVWNPFSGVWLNEPGCAKAIAVGSIVNNAFQVWVIGCGAGDQPIYSWNGSGFTELPGGGRASNVSTDGSVPWVTTSTGWTYQFSGSGWNYQAWVPQATEFMWPGTIKAWSTNAYTQYVEDPSGDFASWIQLGNAAQSIAPGGAGYFGWMTSPGGNICYLQTASQQGNGWCGSNG